MNLRVLWPRRESEIAEPEHPADAALRPELLSAALVLQTHRVPGLMRLFREFGRRAYAKGREDAIREIEQ
jgi:hypothetical protein